MKNLKQKISNIEGGDVLDVATGSGNFVHFIKEFKSFKSILAIDTSNKSEKALKKQFSNLNVKFKIMDAYNMNFPDNTFDTVCISNSLHHLAEPKRVLDEMQRVLKKKGLLVINEMYADKELQEETQLSHVIFHHWWGEIDRLFGIIHNPTYKKAELINLTKINTLNNYEIIDYKYPIEDPKDERLIQQQIKVCQMGIKKLKNFSGTEGLINDGEQIISRLKNIGFASASSLFITATKL